METDGRPNGIVTDRDIVLRTLCRRRDPGTVRVEEIASHPLATIDQQRSIAEAVRVIRHHSVRRLPVVDEKGVLVGMLAADDLLALAVGELSGLTAAVRALRNRRIRRRARKDHRRAARPGRGQPAGGRSSARRERVKLRETWEVAYRSSGIGSITSARRPSTACSAKSKRYGSRCEVAGDDQPAAAWQRLATRIAATHSAAVHSEPIALQEEDPCR